MKHKGVNKASTGDAAALLARTIKKADVVAYPELGPEAIYRLEVEDFPATVVNDAHGNDIYEEGIDPENLLPNMDNVEVFIRQAVNVGLKAIELGIAKKNFSNEELRAMAENLFTVPATSPRC